MLKGLCFHFHATVPCERHEVGESRADRLFPKYSFESISCVSESRFCHTYVCYAASFCILVTFFFTTIHACCGLQATIYIYMPVKYQSRRPKYYNCIISTNTQYVSHTNTRAHAHTQTHTHTHTQIHTRTCAQMHSCMWSCMWTAEAWLLRSPCGVYTWRWW